MSGNINNDEKYYIIRGMSVYAHTHIEKRGKSRKKELKRKNNYRTVNKTNGLYKVW